LGRYILQFRHQLLEVFEPRNCGHRHDVQSVHYRDELSLSDLFRQRTSPLHSSPSPFHRRRDILLKLSVRNAIRPVRPGYAPENLSVDRIAQQTTKTLDARSYSLIDRPARRRDCPSRISPLTFGNRLGEGPLREFGVVQRLAIFIERTHISAKL